MHNIFVTLEEFLENGGTLADGRTLYSTLISAKGTDVGSVFRPFGWYDASIQTIPDKGLVTVSQGYDEAFKVSKECETFVQFTKQVFVAIPVTVPYK